ncbi:MAG TPA: hypothetical protein VGU46_07145 [Acidobacteriaceae bacterium]|nr:hypothetical protein [Acidobacteriaceae bacterium]
MKKIRVFGFAALLAPVILLGCGQPRAVVYAPPPPALDYRAIQDQGFHDGFDAAKHDVESGRAPVFDHHPRWRNPPVPRPGFEAYRKGFREGYDRFLHPGPPRGE